MLISKFEARNPKQIRNSNDQNKILSFEHLKFEFVSNFEFRTSDLESSFTRICSGT